MIGVQIVVHAGRPKRAPAASPVAWARWLRPMRCSDLRWPIGGSMADLRRISRLTCSVTRLAGDGDVDLEAMFGRGVVTAIATVGDDAA